MTSTPAANDSPTSVLAAAAADWLSAIVRALPPERLEILQRSLSDPASEISVRVEFKNKAFVLELSDATRRVELVRIKVDGLETVDGFGHRGEGTMQ